MESYGRPRENGTGFVGFVANGDDAVEMLPQKLFDMLGAVTRNINPDLLHDLHRVFVDPGWLGSRTFDFKLIPTIVPKDPFRHLRPARVAGA